jgi:hypothetical protein
VLSTTQFWTLAGYIYDNRQAKRIYAVLEREPVAARLRAYVGGFLRGVLSVPSMILICIAICIGLIVSARLRGVSGKQKR